MNAAILALEEFRDSLTTNPDIYTQTQKFACGDFYIRLLNERIGELRAQALRAEEAQPVACPVCAETQAFTGTCGGGQSNPMALCYIHSAPAEGWQPIETAPKDETSILLYFPGATDLEDKIRIGWWYEMADGPGWYDSEAASNRMTDFTGMPTRWMPIPAAPKE